MNNSLSKRNKNDVLANSLKSLLIPFFSFPLVRKKLKIKSITKFVREHKNLTTFSKSSRKFELYHLLLDISSHIIKTYFYKIDINGF